MVLITSENVLICGFCDNLEFFRELFPGRKKSSVESFFSFKYIHTQYI